MVDWRIGFFGVSFGHSSFPSFFISVNKENFVVLLFQIEL